MVKKKHADIPRSSEAQEQETVIEYCDFVGVPIVHIPNEGKRSLGYASALKRQGMRRGFPDLFVPRACGKWHGLFIEMKYGCGKTSDDQKKWLKLLSVEGYACAVCYGADEAIKLIEAYTRRGSR